ncbi:hypothetical protein [Escherichia coli]|uniref:hypothetical protein n=1 Tax=Escherichia coli TaxID=562 RepID=UPI0010AD5F55|nr:hypothetical protein [Escherichia coli]TIY83503.1 hypothetical protein C9349_06270 [Escherichia coli]
MEIRSAAEIIATTKIHKNSKSPLVYEQEAISLYDTKKLIYRGFIGEWKGNRTRVSMTCESCNHDFDAMIDSVLRVSGCPMCGRKKASNSLRKSEELALKEAQEIAESRGKDEIIVGFKGGYKNKHARNLTVICKFHGEYTISLAHFSSGCGCSECKKNSISSSRIKPEQIALEEARNEAQKRGRGEIVVGFKDGYKGAHVRNLIIKCPIHGDYITNMTHYINGRGCRECNVHGYRTIDAGELYIQKLIYEGDFIGIKFGITNKKSEERMNVQSKKSKIEHELIFSCRFDDGRKPLDIETMIKRAFKDKIGVVCRDLMPDGFTETLPPDVLLPLLNEVKSICKALS